MAVLYDVQGRFDESEPLHLETLEAQRRVLGENHRDTLWSMSNLATLYAIQGRHDEAEPLHLKTLEARRRVLGENHPDTANSLYNLACFEAMRGNTAQAMDWLRQSVSAGWANAELMGRDADLETLHGSEFDALIERVHQNAAAQRAQ
jgi:hypothetical protein